MKSPVPAQNIFEGFCFVRCKHGSVLHAHQMFVLILWWVLSPTAENKRNNSDWLKRSAETIVIG